MHNWWIDSQVIEPTERDQGIYSIVITDPENSHKRSLDLSGEGLYPLCLINTPSLEFHSVLIDNTVKNRGGNVAGFQVSNTHPLRRRSGLFFSQNNKKKKKNLGFCWFQLNPQGGCFFVAEKCVNISQRKPQSRSVSSQFAPNIGAVFSCSNIPLLTKLGQKEAYLYFHRRMFGRLIYYRWALQWLLLMEY